jgi:hypothetical protein
MAALALRLPPFSTHLGRSSRLRAVVAGTAGGAALNLIYIWMAGDASRQLSPVLRGAPVGSAGAGGGSGIKLSKVR